MPETEAHIDSSEDSTSEHGRDFTEHDADRHDYRANNSITQGYYYPDGGISPFTKNERGETGENIRGYMGIKSNFRATCKSNI